MTETARTFSELLRSARRVAWHLEMRDSYAGTSPAFLAWKAGEPYDRSADDAAWHEIVRTVIGQGAAVRRARIVSEPLSVYSRYLYEATPAANLTAGERVRWLPRRRASNLALPGNDFWLLDDRVVFNHFTGDGEWSELEVLDNAAVVKLCASAFEAVWERGIDHEDYRPA